MPEQSRPHDVHRGGIEAELEAEEQERTQEQAEATQQRERNGVGSAVDSTQNEQVDAL